MATTLEYLQSIASAAVSAQRAVERDDYDAAMELLGNLRDDLDTAEVKLIAEKPS